MYDFWGVGVKVSKTIGDIMQLLSYKISTGSTAYICRYVPKRTYLIRDMIPDT